MITEVPAKDNFDISNNPAKTQGTNAIKDTAPAPIVITFRISDVRYFTVSSPGRTLGIVPPVFLKLLAISIGLIIISV